MTDFREILKFHENPCFMRMDGQLTDRHDRTNSRFHNFVNSPVNLYVAHSALLMTVVNIDYAVFGVCSGDGLCSLCRRLFIALARSRSRASSCEVFDGHGGSRTSSSRVSRLSPMSIIPRLLLLSERQAGEGQGNL
jgi:hypothetical protein